MKVRRNKFSSITTIQKSSMDVFMKSLAIDYAKANTGIN